MSAEHVYSGFFLSAETRGNMFLADVACFKPNSTLRKVLKLETNKMCEEEYGAIIHFKTPVDEKHLTDHSFVTFIENVPPVFVHEILKADVIVHTMKNVLVDKENLPQLKIFLHQYLGKIYDAHSKISTGMFVSITFVVNPNNRGNFTIDIKEGQRFEGEPLEEGEIPEESENDRFSHALGLYKIEHEYRRNAESAKWKAVGLVKLKGYTKIDTRGKKPILKICDHDEKKREIFKSISNGSRITLIKQRKTADGTYEDNKNVAHHYGTIFPYERKSERTGISSRIDNCVELKLRDKCAKSFENMFCKDDKFRVQSNLFNKTEEYWKNGKQFQNNVYKSTLTGYANPPTVQHDENTENLPDDDFSSTEFNDDRTRKYELNRSQYTAHKRALNERLNFVCIQGAPGTGKTYVLATVLSELVRKRSQIIVLTPTRDSLKNISKLLRTMLVEADIDYNDYTFMDESKCERLLNQTEAAKECFQELDIFAEKKRKNKISPTHCEEISRQLLNKTRNEQLKLLLSKVSVVFATVSSAFISIVLENPTFNPCMCIIDDAAQVMEIEMWPAVDGMPKVVLAGDPKQLSSAVFSNVAKGSQLVTSTLERILKGNAPVSCTMLEEQYRCNPDIFRWSNKCFYEGKIINRVESGCNLRRSLETTFPQQFKRLYAPFVMIDTSMEMNHKERILTYEQVEVDGIRELNGPTYTNAAEAQLVIQHYKNLRKAGVPAKSIAICTPYKGQVNLLRDGIEALAQSKSPVDLLLFMSALETKIGTVDSIASQEYTAVIFSMVRSNPKKTIGFVSDLRRLNVLITRAKRHFMFIGNGYLMSECNTPEIRELFNIFKESKRRFHPSYIFHSSSTSKAGVQNNFGQDFGPFIEHTKDEEMKQWCKSFVERGRDPAFRLAQNAKKQQKSEDFVKANNYGEQSGMARGTSTRTEPLLDRSTSNWTPKAPGRYSRPLGAASRPSASPYGRPAHSSSKSGRNSAQHSSNN